MRASQEFGEAREHDHFGLPVIERKRDSYTACIKGNFEKNREQWNLLIETKRKKSIFKSIKGTCYGHSEKPSFKLLSTFKA